MGLDLWWLRFEYCPRIVICLQYRQPKAPECVCWRTSSISLPSAGTLTSTALSLPFTTPRSVSTVSLPFVPHLTSSLRTHQRNESQAYETSCTLHYSNGQPKTDSDVSERVQMRKRFYVFIRETQSRLLSRETHIMFVYDGAISKYCPKDVIICQG